MRALSGRWRRLGCLATRVVAHRRATTVAAHEIAPPQPVVHATIADAHIHASGLLADMLERQPPMSLRTYVDLLTEWWRVVGQLVLLPRASEEIDDLPQFLAECVRTANRSESGGTHGGSTSSSAGDEAALLERWDEWVWSSDPHAMPTAAAFGEAIEEPAMASTNTAVSRREVVSFSELTSLLHSYGRYHRGVRWGASKPSEDGRNGSAAAAAAYHRRRYLLHPWHGVCCPEGTAQQMPYVHVLRWMLAGTAEGEEQASATELWSRHRAIEGFQLPREAASSFRALDVCSQSGYVTDLLLRAGAGLVVAADADVHALGNTESTYHEHLREGRSKRRNQVLLTRRCDELPMPLKSEGGEGSSSSNNNSATAVQKPDEGNVDATNVSAAEQRRRRARQQGRGYSGLRGGASSADADVAPASLPDGSPFHVVYFHPPAPSAVWPVIAADGAATASSLLHRTAWWQSLVRRAARTGLPPRLLLPFVPCSASAGRGSNPLTTLSGLRRAVEELRSDVTERSSASSLYATHGAKSADAVTTTTGGGDVLLREDGYVVLVLPRSYDVGELLQATGEESMEKAPSLADWVIAQLDGYYDIVLRRRCRLHEAPSKAASAAATLDAVEEALVAHPSRLAAPEDSDATQRTEQVGNDRSSSTAAGVPAGSGATKDATHTPQWREQLSHFYEKEWWQDVIVLRKNPAMVQRSAAARHGDKAQLFHQQLQQRRLAQLRRRFQQENAVAWEDSFEYNEYHPRDGSALVSHHWTDLMPTYSYLESDFYDDGAGQRNFLAVGHAPASVHTRPATAAGYVVPSGETGVTAGHTEMTAAASAKAAMNFHTLFAQELRTRRRSKLRKLALSPLERQEWYIDEKLVKASGARVDLMNELSKWDFKDYDN